VGRLSTLTKPGSMGIRKKKRRNVNDLARYRLRR
jgi:hypothetical protein